MKKFVCIFLTSCVLLSVCGCGNNETTTENESIETIYEEIIVNENESTVSSTPDSTTSEVESETTEDQTTDTTSDKKDDIVIDYDTVVEVDLCDDIIRGYLSATTPTTQYVFLSQYDNQKLDHQYLPLEWKLDGSSKYTLYVSEKADFSDAYITNITGVNDGLSLVSGKVKTICIPGKTYYWKVLGQYNDTPRGGGKIKIKNQPVRWISLDGVDNVRDMGGWKTEDGKTVNYGKIYRGSKLEGITDSGISTLKALGVKTDIDIRSTAEWDSHGAVPSTGLKYYFFDTNSSYDYILGNGNSVSEDVRKNYPAIFEMLADESNYPIYLHCNYGNDRTGTMAFVLNGLLGVNYEDLTRDFELTSYAFTHDRRWRGNGTGGTFGPNDLIQNNISNSNVDGRWGMLNKAFMESTAYCTDGKLSTSIENFLLAAGVKKEHIESYKKIMLE